MFVLSAKLAGKFVSFCKLPGKEPIFEHKLLCEFKTYELSMDLLNTYHLPLPKVRINFRHFLPYQRQALLTRLHESSRDSLEYLIAVEFSQDDFPSTFPHDYKNLLGISLIDCDIDFNLLSEFPKLHTVTIKYPPVEFFNANSNSKIVIPKMTSLALALTVGNILPDDPANLCIDLQNVEVLEIEAPFVIQKAENPQEPHLSKFIKRLDKKIAPKLNHLILSGFGPTYCSSLMVDFQQDACALQIKYIDLNLCHFNAIQISAFKQLFPKPGALLHLHNDLYRVNCHQGKELTE